MPAKIVTMILFLETLIFFMPLIILYENVLFIKKRERLFPLSRVDYPGDYSPSLSRSSNICLTEGAFLVSFLIERSSALSFASLRLFSED